MSLIQAQAIARSYTERFEKFQLQLAQVEQLFARTELAETIEQLKSWVEDAWQLNMDAGWLPMEGEGDWFLAQIKHDPHGQRISTLAHVPDQLKAEYAQMGEAEFQAYLEEMRKDFRAANEEMSFLRRGIEHVLVEHGLFDVLWGWVDEAANQDSKSIEPLVGNLQSIWKSFHQLAVSLLQMAHDPADGDFDSTLTDDLLFERS